MRLQQIVNFDIILAIDYLNLDLLILEEKYSRSYNNNSL